MSTPGAAMIARIKQVVATKSVVIHNTKNQPTQLWRIVEQFDGKFDTTTIHFLVDTNGLVTEEQIYKKKTLTNFIYYYYDERDNLTDIVRYNDTWKRLLPDQLFEYDDNGNIIQRMQLTGSRDVSYLIWRYGYGENGLLKEEALFNNKKEHTGSIRYAYQIQTR
jgi:antitoxin component YwqK of YwqJK toxin-antitoxin module